MRSKNQWMHFRSKHTEKSNSENTKALRKSKKGRSKQAENQANRIMHSENERKQFRSREKSDARSKHTENKITQEASKIDQALREASTQKHLLEK